VANSFYLDASALAKRYLLEKGTAQVNVDTVRPERIYVLNVGAGEVVSIFVRKRNAGKLPLADFRDAMLNFNAEIARAVDVKKMPVSNRLALSTFPLIDAHSINSTDAITLKSALAIARKLRVAGDDPVLVASDQRLLRAAQQMEGLVTFNPETQAQAALAPLLAP
jgi:predicted nucleic acid-binding protein